MAIHSDDNLGLLKVMRTLLEAEVQLEKELLEAAPMPAGDFEDNNYNDLDKLYRRYMPSSEVIEIIRFFFMLDAAGVITGERLHQLIKSHNRRIAHLKKIPDFSKRKLTFDRLDSGMFSDGARHDAISNFNDHGRAAFNVRTICRLLVEVASRAIITEAMGLLVTLGFFEKVPGGAFHSNVIVSDGRLEAIYRRYLTRVQQGMSDGLPAQARHFRCEHSEGEGQ